MNFLFVFGLYAFFAVLVIGGAGLAHYFFSKGKTIPAFSIFFGAVAVINILINVVFN